MMHRTQIYFPEFLRDDLKIESAMLNVSFSEYIRMILEEKIYNKPMRKIVRRKASRQKKPKLSLLAKHSINMGPPDLAKNFDKYFEKSLK